MPLSSCPSWGVYEEGVPHCIQVDDLVDLPGEVRFSFTKTAEFLSTRQTGWAPKIIGDVNLL